MYSTSRLCHRPFGGGNAKDRLIITVKLNGSEPSERMQYGVLVAARATVTV
jgi:hypothetical protein